MIKATLHTDGGARGNPGPAGIGAVLEMSAAAGAMARQCEKKLFKKYIGETTNNQAEYQALILGLEKAKELGVQEIECLLDSELVVKQLNREYKVKDAGLALLFVKIWNLAQCFEKISYKHIFREQNKLADRLVNEAIDERRG